MTAGTGRHRPACGPVTVTYHRRNQLLTRLGLCAAGGLVVGGLLAIPFSGDDGGTSTLSAPTVSVAVTSTSRRAPVTVTTDAGTTPASSQATTTAGSTATTLDPPATAGAVTTDAVTGALPTIPGVDAPA